jgi:integrase
MMKLTDLDVRRTTTAGLHPDGGGLYLSVTPTKVAGALSKSWVVRYTAPDGRRRAMGLGSYPEVSLAAARRQAASVRERARNGADPIEAKREARRAAALKAMREITFRRCAESFIETHRAGWRNEKHATQWRSTLSTYVYPVFGDLPIGAIDTAMVTKVLDPIWSTKNETASRVRGRIEMILDWAKARGHREGENPARWKGHLQHALPARRKVAKVEHHAALPFDEIGLFLRALRAMDGLSARALEFAILTAARTGEVIGARWDEIDIDAKLWSVPASRMKGGREHRVPLSASAIAILTPLISTSGRAYVFATDSEDVPLSNMALLMTLRRMKRSDVTVHGFRSTFRDWASERTNYSREVAEAALAHAVGDRVEAAYRRGDLFGKRRKLMEAWGSYCGARAAQQDGEIIRLRTVAKD